MNAESKKHLLFLIFIAAVLLIGFSPAVFNVYIFHDDLFYWQAPASLNKFPNICSLTMYVGRFLGGIIQCSYYSFINVIADLNKVRFVINLIIVFCALCSYGLLLKYFKRSIDAALISIIVFSLPAFEVWSSHAGQSYEVFALMFVILGVYMVDKVPVEGRLINRLVQPASLMTILLLVCAWMVYPALATFYWALAAVILLAQIEIGSLRAKIENIYIPAIIATFIYASIFKFRKLFLKKTFIENSYQPDSLVTNIQDKFLWFFQTVIPQSLNLWNIFPSNLFALLLAIFILGAVVITLIKEWRKGDTKGFYLRFFVASLILSSLFVLSYLPNLLCVINFNPYRCAAGLTALWVISLIWALQVYCSSITKSLGQKAMTLVLCIVCLWGIYRCFDNVDRFRAKPSALEYAFLKSSLNNFHGTIKEIYFVPLQQKDLYYFYDEFGETTFLNNYSKIVFFINALIVDVEEESGFKWVYLERQTQPGDYKTGDRGFYLNNSTYKYYFQDTSIKDKKVYSSLEIKIVVGPRPQWKLDDSTLLIDMNELYEPLKKEMGKEYNFKVINKRSWTGE